MSTREEERENNFIFVRFFFFAVAAKPCFFRRNLAANYDYSWRTTTVSRVLSEANGEKIRANNRVRPLNFSTNSIHGEPPNEFVAPYIQHCGSWSKFEIYEEKNNSSRLPRKPCPAWC